MNNNTLNLNFLEKEKSDCIVNRNKKTLELEELLSNKSELMAFIQDAQNLLKKSDIEIEQLGIEIQELIHKEKGFDSVILALKGSKNNGSNSILNEINANTVREDVTKVTDFLRENKPRLNTILNRGQDSNDIRIDTNNIVPSPTYTTVYPKQTESILNAVLTIDDYIYRVLQQQQRFLHSREIVAYLEDAANKFEGNGSLSAKVSNALGRLRKNGLIAKVNVGKSTKVIVWGGVRWIKQESQNKIYDEATILTSDDIDPNHIYDKNLFKGTLQPL